MDDADLSDAAVEAELTGPDNRGGGFTVMNAIA